MKALIWKEWLENLKWVPLPGLVILIVFLIARPMTPMPDVTQAFFNALVAVGFGAGLGFVQIYFDGHGDKRSLLLHRPLSPSRIFLAKALAGVGLYVVALGIPLVCLESWFAMPKTISAPYHWRTALPWLADIVSGLVYYFAGMLLAQREVRWYGSRGFALAAALLCSCLVWGVPEFWQALVAIGIIGSVVAVTAWGSFCTGGSYARQPGVAKIALAVTFLAGLTMLSMLGKQMIGAWTESGIEWNHNLDRGGRVLLAPFKEGVGAIGPWIDVSGKEPPDLKGKVIDSRVLAPWTAAGKPLDWSYRNSGRFYVFCANEFRATDEIWFYDQFRRRLFGYDPILHYCVGSIGPDGFVPPDEQPRECFPRDLCYQSTRWQSEPQHFLAFPTVVYDVDFGRRKIRTLFTPAGGETVTSAGWWRDVDKQRQLIVVTTDRSIHFLKEDGSRVVSIPREYETHQFVLVGQLEKPDRFFAWYPSRPWLVEPQDYQTASNYLCVYDAAGRELACSAAPPLPFPPAPYANVLFGLVTPMTEAATLVGASRYLRSEAQLQGGTHKSVLLDYLENSRYYIPGTTWYEAAPTGSIAVYIALMMLSAAASALACFWLTRRYAYHRASSIGWPIVGFFFGWVGLVLMLALHEWPARIACSKCGGLRVVTRDTCEHCGAAHATPKPDGTEVFEEKAAISYVPQSVRV
jgi:hypothetical protein